MAANETKDDLYALALQKEEEDKYKEYGFGSDETDPPLPLTVASRVLYMLGDIAAGPAFRFSQWLELVRKRSSKSKASGFPHRPQRLDRDLSLESNNSPPEQVTEISLWERLGKAAMLNIESSSFSWDMLSSLHHTEHSSCNDSEDDMNKALEVTVNSGGVVFFALFNHNKGGEFLPKEAAAVIKIASSRMATQSERLGYEFAKWLGVRTPQARVIHNCSSEWLKIKEAAEKARETVVSDGDEVGEMTCSELIEALELSRCLYLMNYVHGSPLLENSSAFTTQEAAEKTSAALGRILMLDLVIRNEDRLPCRHLRWRGNSANLLLADKMATANRDALEEAFDSAINRYRPRVIRALQKERRSTSVDSRLSAGGPDLASKSSDTVLGSPMSGERTLTRQVTIDPIITDFDVVAIDSVVPRRPPAGKRAHDQENYPKLVELLINSPEYASHLLYEITIGKLGVPPEAVETPDNLPFKDMTSVIHEFRSGFRAALMDLQGFHIFLLTLHQKLDSLLRAFMNIIDRTSAGDFEKEDLMLLEPSSHSAGGLHYLSPQGKERGVHDSQSDSNDTELQKTAPKVSSSGFKENLESTSPMSRDASHGKSNKGSAEPLRTMRMTTKLRDFHKHAKVDAELNKALEQWNELLKSEALKLCQENNFNSGFFEGSDNNAVVDAYELKLRLEHILERISLISDAGNTEKPSSITGSLFIGGALAARSVYTLQHLGITHILCLCSNEIGQADSQRPDLFEYQNFCINDEEDSDISLIFEEAHQFINDVEKKGGKVLVVVARNFTLLKAWNTLRRAHRRAQPNDGFAKILVELDKKLHGMASMEWQQKKPAMKVCPICGKNAGLSSSSLKLHLQKSHKKLSSGSVDSAMTMEIQKAIYFSLFCKK
ncbi:Actin-fragmin kinase, catalytic domain-containing protein [Cynara cardunculus var. scolymus]|uniref:Actin-fragmin kinase, catalytic domain-containing protein n=1 Tax=Cynara cardunculus var. scolymus TaxID=59895 RepID=A0A103YBM9_CYNCS|nr:Actin-fragmin kinase, catalytic domain-containing protein [Cynara cardunculus var. scolymus]